MEALADALQEHVDCVVGASGSVSDTAARSFVIGFYGGLAEGVSVEAAFRQGLAAADVDGLRDDRQPGWFLKVRAGVDPAKLVLVRDAR
jgi:hypothetical protein